MFEGGKPDANMKLGDMVNSCFSKKSPELDALTAVYTVLGDSVFMLSWPTVDDGANVIYVQLTARPVSPKQIGY